MPNIFSVNKIILGSGLVTATGTSLYINGFLAGSGIFQATGSYASSDSLSQTGANLSNQILALSGYFTGSNGGTISYLTGLNPTGFDTYYINHPVAFPSIPRVSLTMELNNGANSVYGFAVSGRSTTGFFVMLTNVLDNSGVYFDVLAKS